MSPPALYLRGLAIGFAIAAAIGPIGLLCIQRTLAEGRAIGLATGLSRTWSHPGLPAAYATTLGLTITNPATILSFAAAFVGFGLVAHGGPGAAALVLGVFSGSSAWWVLLVAVVGVLRPRVGPVALRRVAAASAGLIAAIGAVAIWTSLLSG